MCEERREGSFPKAAQGHILGDDRFIETSQRLADQSPFFVRLESIITAVCAARTLDLPTLSAAGRGHQASEARALIAYLALEKRAGTLTKLARLLNRDVSTLSNAAARIRQRIKTDSELAREVDRLADLLEIGRIMRKRTTTKA